MSVLCVCEWNAMQCDVLLFEPRRLVPRRVIMRTYVEARLNITTHCRSVYASLLEESLRPASARALPQHQLLQPQLLTPRQPQTLLR